MIAHDLAGQPNPGQAASGQTLLFGGGVRHRLAFDELDTARRAAGISAAGVQDIHVQIVLNRENEPLSIWDLNRPEPFHSQFWHTPTIVRGNCRLQISECRLGRSNRQTPIANLNFQSAICNLQSAIFLGP
ncbi:MAG TPA: hypothetical protein VM032_19575 [Vicinamibacterales bacterium]|nr:hypothetical protein [Vicinamibacterales bacterium]